MRFLAILPAAIALSLAFIPFPPAYSQDRLAIATLAALDFGEVRSVQLARIDGSSYGQSSAPNSFDGYPLISPWRALPLNLGSEIVFVLRDQLRSDLAFCRTAQPDTVRLSSFCLFDPGYALRVGTDHGERTFLVCLVCDQLEVYDGRKHFWSGRPKHYWSTDFDKPMALRLAELFAAIK